MWVEHEFREFRKSLVFASGEPTNFLFFERGHRVYRERLAKLAAEELAQASHATKLASLTAFAAKMRARRAMEAATQSIVVAFGDNSPEHNLALDALQAIMPE